jgi:hypothetical protein
MDQFGLADLIRMNQLVRARIDLDGFQAWYETLPLEGRGALTYMLCEFAHQAGVHESTWDEALAASGLPSSDPVVRRLWAARRDEFQAFPLYEFVRAAPEKDLPTVFRLFVYLFGIAERAVYRAESKMWCNHWWHRDLLDERVVQDLLADPHYYKTAMKDDARIKRRV